MGTQQNKEANAMNTTFDPATTPVCQSCGMPLTQPDQVGKEGGPGISLSRKEPGQCETQK